MLRPRRLGWGLVGLATAWLGVTSARPARAADSPAILENQALALHFDRHTGAWTGFVDKRTGQNLARRPALPVPSRPVRLDAVRLRAAVAQGRAVSLEGEWLYTPTSPPRRLTEDLPQGTTTGVSWASTPVPSRRGTGDDRLHNRTGDFWYRREFVAPPQWPKQEEMALALGAVDDFDVAWVNGARIGSTGQDTPNHWEAPRFYRFPGGLLKPGATNVVVLKVTNGAYDGGIGAPVVLGMAGTLLPTGPAEAAANKVVFQESPDRLTFSARAGPWEYRWEFKLNPQDALLERRLTVKNLSATEAVLQTASYQSPVFCLGTHQAVIFPGSLPVGDQFVESIPEGEALGPRSQEPLAILWDGGSQRGLGTWFHSEEEFAPVSAGRVGAGVEIRHRQQVVARVGAGESLKLGCQYFWLAHGGRDQALQGVRAVYSGIGLRAPTNSLPGLPGMVMYCGHPGGPPELRFLDYGGFQALRAYVPTLRRMQVDLLWLLPTWEHGNGKRWNLYAPFDHFQVDHLLGTADDLKALATESATAGMRIMFDLVPHGPPDFTPLGQAHPDWVARKPDGTMHYEWGQLAFDNNHSGWQDYMRRAAEWGAREFGAIGARVDCGAGGPLNWDRELTSRPSLSSLAAGLGMNRAIREGYLRVHPAVVVLPEEYTGANIFWRVADLTYDAQLYFLQAELLERGATPAEWARQLQQFLHDQRQTLPPGALKMRWISNHDTVSWTFQKQRPAIAYGLERMRALLALCALIEGVPMLYQGDEDPAVYRQPGPSSVGFLARVYGVRKHLPALCEGTADYISVLASEGVFACLRRHGDQRAIVLISLNPAPVSCAVSGPAALSGAWNDAFSGERILLGDAARTPMSPWQVRVLTSP